MSCGWKIDRYNVEALALTWENWSHLEIFLSEALWAIRLWLGDLFWRVFYFWSSVYDTSIFVKGNAIHFLLVIRAWSTEELRPGSRNAYAHLWALPGQLVVPVYGTVWYQGSVCATCSGRGTVTAKDQQPPCASPLDTQGPHAHGILLKAHGANASRFHIWLQGIPQGCHKQQGKGL